MRKGLSLDKLELRLQELIEIHLVKHLPGSSPEDLVIHQLAAAVRSNLDYDNSTEAPQNSYQLRVDPFAYDQWQNNAELLGELMEVIKTVTTESGREVVATPTIQVVSDASLNPGDIRIEAATEDGGIEETKGELSGNRLKTSDRNPSSAFLIVAGTRVFPLDRSVINIGRRGDNHLILDDPRVSRYHAQLRLIRGRFVVFDLSSTGGTFVNGQRTAQCVLYPGDVVSLAGLSLIFGQDAHPLGPAGRGTEPLKPAPINDRPTILLKGHPEENPES